MFTIKSNKIIALTAFALSVAVFIVPFFIRTKSESIITVLSLSLTAIGTVLTAATFVIAILLYDRFSLDKRILDEQTETVLQLINFLKGRLFEGSTGGYHYMIRPSISQLSQYNTTPNFSINRKKNILISPDDYEQFSSLIMGLMRSYWMPTEIKEKMKFFEFYGYSEIDLSDSDFHFDNFVCLNFGIKADKNWHFAMPEMTLEAFIGHLISLVEEIEKWIQSRSSIPIELRLWEPN